MNKSKISANVREKVSDGLVKILRPIVAPIVRARTSTRKGKGTNADAGKRPLILRFAAQDQISFAKRLGMILRAGMPIMEGLHMLGGETRSRSSTFIYQSLILHVGSGQSLSTGLGTFQSIFGEFCINIVKVGETSGTLPENLEYLAEELKKKQALRRKVLGALLYPAIIVTATVGITVMLTVYIFPKIIPIFQSVKATLPLSTRMLIIISHFLGAWGIALFGALVALTVLFVVLMKMVPRFHAWMDIALLHIPVLGKLSQYYNLANSARTLSGLRKASRKARKFPNSFVNLRSFSLLLWRRWCRSENRRVTSRVRSCSSRTCMRKKSTSSRKI